MKNIRQPSTISVKDRDVDETKELDWTKAANHLKSAERVYGEVGAVGAFARSFVIKPCRKRFDMGERSQELWDEIIEISL